MQSDCIKTPYATDTGGYGKLKISMSKLNTATVSHHRLVYAEANGLKLSDIADKVVMHTCDNPSCVNPAHLVLGTQQDNVNDMWTKGRQGVKGMKGSTHPGSKLTEDVVRAIRNNRREAGAVLAATYGVSKATVSMILNNKIWTHVV